MHASPFGVREVQIRAYRSARSVGFSPGPVCALVGGPSVGKSNVLAAVWMLLEHGAPGPAPNDLSAGSAGPIRVSATLADGDEIALVTSPSESGTRRGRPVPVLFLPASERSGRLVATTSEQVLARSSEWIFAPDAPYERIGDVDQVVFSCGWQPLDDGDTIRIYYGAADTSICLATASISELLGWLARHSD